MKCYRTPWEFLRQWTRSSEAAFVLFARVADVAMHLWRHVPSFALALTLSGPTQGQNVSSEVDSQWRKPAKFWDTDLRETIDATGTFDFTFNSSSLPKGVKYGSYDYCNMPHVRRQEYKIPLKEFRLEYVEVIHRHHKRTSYASNLASDLEQERGGIPELTLP